VAKDWCETIRASQVVPIYPLTADLQPGDLFLVQQTVASQHEAYEDAGFLPLPYKIARVDPTGYSDHYDTTSQTLSGSTLPGGIGADRPDPNTTALSAAPTAAFPTYAFEVNNGAAFDLAVPVSGVPVGLSAMGASGASVTVTIKDAKTYGVDAFSIDRDVRRWALDPEVRTFLKGMTSRDEPVYVRVVSRVYLAREFDIAMNRRDSRGLGLSAGISSEGPSSLIAATPNDDPNKTTAEDYEKNLAALNTSVSNSLKPPVEGSPVGGDLRFVAASASTVSLREKFDEPLVVGYVGFDMRVRVDGSLGPPIPTFRVLEEKQVPSDREFIGAFTGGEGRYIDLFDAVLAMPTETARQEAFARAADQLGIAMATLYRSTLADETPREAWNTVFDAQLDGVNDPREREWRYDRLAAAIQTGIQAMQDVEE
jgi:hypothetical protein